METLIASLALMIEFIAEDLVRSDPLACQVPLRLPDNVHNVGQAAQFFADKIDYHLVQGFSETEESDRIARQPITLNYPADTCLPMEEAILSLVGSPCQLVVDHNYRIFAFRRVPAR